MAPVGPLSVPCRSPVGHLSVNLAIGGIVATAAIGGISGIVTTARGWQGFGVRRWSGRDRGRGAGYWERLFVMSAGGGSEFGADVDGGDSAGEGVEGGVGESGLFHE